MELIAVILKSPTSTQRFESAKVLLNYGFAAYGLAEVEPEEPLTAIPVRLGTAASVTVEMEGEEKLLVTKDKIGTMEVQTQLETELVAPVEKGQQVGTLTVTSGEEILAQLPLVAGETVERLSYGQIFLRYLRMAFLGG